MESKDEKCRLHGKVMYIQIPSRGIGVCRSCLEAGLYIDEIFAEAQTTEPALELKV